MKTNTKCPCSGGTLTKLVHPGILMVLAREPLHGYAVVQRLGSLRLLKGTRPDPTGVYRVLKSMEARGLVTCSWSRSSSGPAKRLYRLTASGTRCLGQWVATLREFDAAVTELLLTAQAICRPSPRKRGIDTRKG